MPMSRYSSKKKKLAKFISLAKYSAHINRRAKCIVADCAVCMIERNGQIGCGFAKFPPEDGRQWYLNPERTQNCIYNNDC